MTTRLASETIRISLGGTTAELTPSLRAALRLARRYGTYGALVGKISAGDVQAIADTIDEGAEGVTFLPIILKEIEERGLLSILAYLQAPLIDFVIALAGPAADEEGKSEEKASTGTSSTSSTFDAFHEQLFEIATGMLGWSPAEAWAATPAEIMAAHKGRIALLRMIFGGGDETGETKTAHDRLSLDEQAMAVFSRGPRKRAA